MKRSRLLILDDDAQIAQTIATIAQAYGIEARVATEAAHFFAEVESWQPTHIALDLVMPGMDGVEVMVQLAHRNCDANIIITSGVGPRVLDAAGRSAREHGLRIAGVLSKPFSPAALRDLLHIGTSTLLLHGAGTAAFASVGGELRLEELEQAIALGQLSVAYQPKVACQDGTLAGFEALVRWNHPERGLVAPDRFIPLAESSVLIAPLTHFVLERALSWFSQQFGNARGCAGAGNPLTMSVNISARTLSDIGFVDRALALCQDFGIAPAQIIFELTETSAMEDPVASLDLLTRLRVQGFQLSIDDFGTGFSSMLQLARLPFSEIKVDKSFVMSAGTSQESRVVIKSITDLGRSLGLRSTAEGVEDESCLQYLREIGCDLAQGYYIGRPMDGDAALAWSAARAKKVSGTISGGNS